LIYHFLTNCEKARGLQSIFGQFCCFFKRICKYKWRFWNIFSA